MKIFGRKKPVPPTHQSASQPDTQTGQLLAIVESLQEKIRLLETALQTPSNDLEGVAPLAVPAVATEPGRKVGPTRRRLLRGLALGALAGAGATTLLLGETQATQAKVTVNPGTNPRVGAISNIGGTVSGTVAAPTAFGMIGNSESALNLSTVGHNSFIDINGNRVGVAGVVQGNAGIGVYGESTGGQGVFGAANNYEGVYGLSISSYGVSGQTSSLAKAGVWAYNTNPAGVALEINQGSFKVHGAGVKSSTTAFTHQTTPDNVSTNITQLDNIFTNNNPNVLLFVTHNWNPPGTQGSYELYQFGVFYLTSSQRWCIFHENVNQNMPVGLYFNVLVIVP